MPVIHGTSSEMSATQPAKPQIALPMSVVYASKKTSIRNPHYTSPAHLRSITMILCHDHACCEQHRCLGYSSSTQTGCVSNETVFFFRPYLRHLVTTVWLSFWLEYKNGKNVLCGGVAFVKTPWALRLVSTTRCGDRFCITIVRGQKENRTTTTKE